MSACLLELEELNGIRISFTVGAIIFYQVKVMFFKRSLATISLRLPDKLQQSIRGHFTLCNTCFNQAEYDHHSKAGFLLGEPTLHFLHGEISSARMAKVE